MNDLNQKMARGAAWMVLLRFSERAIGLVSTILLARILVPADFGLIAMAMSVYAAVEIMTMFSFDIALIQNRDAGKEHFDTAWTFNIIFGGGIMLLMAAAAYPAAGFYADERVAPVMMWLGLGAFIRGFENIGVIYFQKDLNLRKEFELGLTRKLIGFAVTVGIALAYQSYWALVIGTLVQRVFGVAMTFVMHPYRPRLSMAKAAELFAFGKWLAINNLLIFLNHRVPDIFIGRQLGPASLGLFNVSYEVANLPTTELVFPIGRAVFPGYSALANDSAGLRTAYLRVLGLIVFLTMPVAAGMYVLAEPMVMTVLGSKWRDSIPLIQTLALFGFIRAVISNSGSVYVALGAPRLTTYMSIYYLAILLPAMWYCISHWQLAGAAYAVLLTAACQTPIALFVAFRMVGAGFGSLIELFWRPTLATAMMWIAIELLQHQPQVQAWAHPLRLMAGIAVGAVVYVGAILSAWTLTGRRAGAERDLLPMLVPKRFRSGLLREVHP